MKKWHFCQMDVTNVFLYGEQHEEVYMKIPLGYGGPGLPILCTQGGEVCQTRC